MPAFIVIAVENGGNDGKGSERGLEYDTMSDRSPDSFNDEVLPAVLNNKEIKAAYPKLAFTDDPWGRGVMGCSSGARRLYRGLVSSRPVSPPDCLLRHLCRSAGRRRAEEEGYPLGVGIPFRQEAHRNRATKAAAHFHACLRKRLSPERSGREHHNWVMAGQRTAAALKAKGYDYRFVFSQATGHCDGKVFEQTLADTLVWMAQL